MFSLSQRQTRSGPSMFHVDLAGIDEGNADLASDLTVNMVRGQHTARGRGGFQPGGNVHPVTKHIVAVNDDVAQVDADPEIDRRPAFFSGFRACSAC